MNQKGGMIGPEIRLAHSLEDPLEYCQLSQASFNCGDKEEPVSIKHFVASKLSSSQKDWLMDLFARNMKSLYVKSIEGWQPRSKKIEMFSKRSRFLVAYVGGGGGKNKKPVAFTHFQFDMDYGRQVVYCYEIQVEQEWRGSGIGKFIMSTLEQIASTLKIPLVVLTVFKHNPDAHEFFKSNGYEIDETCPEEEEGMDYFILSKQVDISSSGTSNKKIPEISDATTANLSEETTTLANNSDT